MAAIPLTLVGDSTVTAALGWGNGFIANAPLTVVVSNMAVSGESSQSYRDCLWAANVIATNAQYVLIQFGHNDDYSVNTDCLGNAFQTTLGQFQTNLTFLVNDARSHGKNPVLVTNLDTGDGAWNTHAGLDARAGAMRTVATSLAAPLIDLYALSKAKNLSLGQAGAAALYVDNVHLNSNGSAVMGQIVAQALSSAVPALAAYIGANMVSGSFAVDDTTTFPNPERGFFWGSSGGLLANTTQFANDCLGLYNNTTGLATRTPCRLVRCDTNIGAFKTANIDGTFNSGTGVGTGSLGIIATNLAALRSTGMKATVRFAYDFSGSAAPDTSLTWVQTHCAQLKPLLDYYQDVIYAVEAGFIGQWGEWHDSGASGLDNKSNKRAVHLAVQNMVPPNIPILCTNIYPMMEDWFIGAVLNPASAFSGSEISRWGFHSDCYMTGPDDSFRFPGPVTVVDFVVQSTQIQQRTYVINLSEFAPFGGETCSSSGQRLACSGGTDNIGTGGILNEGPRYHLSYLNMGYDVAFMNAWNSSGCWPTVTAKIGHRFDFRDITHPDTVERGGSIKFVFNVRNTGWSRCISPVRRFGIRARSGSNAIVAKSAVQLRQIPSQMSTNVPVAVTMQIPANAVPGTYSVHMEMLDGYPNLENVRAYKIRPANIDSGSQQWDEANGWWTTGTSFTVVSAGAVPQWTDALGAVLPAAILPSWTVSTANAGDTLVLDLGVPIGTLTNFNYQVLRDGSSAGMPSASGATSLSYQCPASASDYTISVVVTPANASGAGNPVTVAGALVLSS